jgi:bifunctional UDP-N-acetylglucosamine pyrophosphorylase/glucosamine-1-phosphate N-acetyltransferase
MVMAYIASSGASRGKIRAAFRKNLIREQKAMETDCIAVILAAGEGKRMKSSLPKVLHAAAGRPLAQWVMEAAREATGKKPVLVVGAGAERLREYFGERAAYAMQERQLGTGHAVMAAKEYLTGDGYALVAAGDMPLLRMETMKRLIDTAREQRLGVCVLSAMLPDPAGYGRVIRGEGCVARIVEHRDATEAECAVCEINTSVYCFRIPALLEALDHLSNQNDQGEYYLTDCVEYIAKKGYGAQALRCADAGEALGVNDRAQLAAASMVLRGRINKALMESGVTLIDPDSTYIGADVRVGCDAVIYPGVTLEGSTVIEEEAVLYPGSRIENSCIGRGTKVQNSVIVDSKVGEYTIIGPYAYLRPGSEVGSHCRVGDFVEVKNAQIKDGAKVSHLSYIGDGEIGEKSNIGCGVVFVNYDGKKKSRTVVGSNVFVGCNANLVAPVTIGDGAYIAAGSTVTQDVEGDALCIARSRQTIIPGWAKKRRDG